MERTGSTLLVQMLSSTQVAGNPIEYFNPVMQAQPRLRKILGDSNLLEGFAKILDAATTPNGIFGAKIHWNHFRFLAKSLDGEWEENKRLELLELLRGQLPRLLSQAEANELLSAMVPDVSLHTRSFEFLRSHIPDLCVISLLRRNRVARAISHYRAFKTGVWYKGVGNAERKEPPPPIEFDLGEIHTMRCLAGFGEAQWEQFFQENKITPYRLFFEELVQDPLASVKGVLDFLEIDASGASSPKIVSEKQADETSLEWEERYRDAAQAAGVL
jgi:LPS sulfotransferase NodH